MGGADKFNLFILRLTIPYSPESTYYILPNAKRMPSAENLSIASDNVMKFPVVHFI